MTTIYHNPRCSKSRETLNLLEAQGISPDIVKYMEQPISATKLKQLLAMLGISARDLLRKKEAEYKSLGLADSKLSDSALIKAMIEHPKLMERPIVEHEGKAALGRPPENVLSIL